MLQYNVAYISTGASSLYTIPLNTVHIVHIHTHIKCIQLVNTAKHVSPLATNSTPYLVVLQCCNAFSYCKVRLGSGDHVNEGRRAGLGQQLEKSSVNVLVERGGWEEEYRNSGISFDHNTVLIGC